MRLCPTALSLLLLAGLLCACAGQQAPVIDTTSDTTIAPSPVVPTATATEEDVDLVGAPTITAPAHIAGHEAGLFTDAATEGSLDTAGDPTIVRTRFVNVNFDLLDRADSPDEEDQSAISNVLVLNLFNDVVLTAALDRVEPNRSGGYSWIGHLEGVEHSQVILVVEDGLMAGNIALPEAFYQVRYAGNNVHAIYQIDQSAFPPEDEPISPDE